MPKPSKTTCPKCNNVAPLYWLLHDNTGELLCSKCFKKEYHKLKQSKNIAVMQ